MEKDDFAGSNAPPEEITALGYRRLRFLNRRVAQETGFLQTADLVPSAVGPVNLQYGAQVNHIGVLSRNMMLFFTGYFPRNVLPPRNMSREFNRGNNAIHLSDSVEVWVSPGS